MSKVRTFRWCPRVQVEGHPGRGKGVLVAVELLVLRDGLLKLLLAHVAPGTDGVAHDFDVELRHFAGLGQCRPEHASEFVEDVVCRVVSKGNQESVSQRERKKEKRTVSGKRMYDIYILRLFLPSGAFLS